jgi:hypothetical protein
MNADISVPPSRERTKLEFALFPAARKERRLQSFGQPSGRAPACNSLQNGTEPGRRVAEITMACIARKPSALSAGSGSIAMSVLPISFARANLHAAPSPASAATSVAMPGPHGGSQPGDAPPGHGKHRRDARFDQAAEGLLRSMAQPGVAAMGTLVNVMA